jgi:hypothetical protein
VVILKNEFLILASKQRLLAGLASVLSVFTHLAFIDLSPTAVHGSWTLGRSSSEEEIGLLAEWGRACPSLKRVIFPSESDWMLDVTAGTWVNAATVPVAFSAAPVVQSP